MYLCSRLLHQILRYSELAVYGSKVSQNFCLFLLKKSPFVIFIAIVLKFLFGVFNFYRMYQNIFILLLPEMFITICLNYLERRKLVSNVDVHNVIHGQNQDS